MVANRQIATDPDTGAIMIDQINTELAALYQAAVLPLVNTGGTANDPEVSVTPALTVGLVAGMKFVWTPSATNTGAMTIKVGAETAVDLKRDDGTDLGAGQISANRMEFLYFDGTDMRIAAMTGIQRVFNRQTFTASGTWTNSFPADSLVMVEAWGPGGTGGRTSGAYVGSGGGGGAYCWGLFRAGDLGASVTVTVGASGALGSTGAASSAGSNSTFGSYLTGYAGGPGRSTNLSAVSGGAGAGSNGKGGAGQSDHSPSVPGGIDGGTGANTDDSTSAGKGTDGGGGGGAASKTNSTSSEGGGASNKGGGGGGGLDGVFSGNGGSSVYGGNGGNYGTAGFAPAGGGGGNALGARGEVRVTVIG